MKRASEFTTGAQPLLKRAHSDGDIMMGGSEDAHGDSSTFHLRSQNRALSLELLRYKRSMQEARRELDMMRGKSREMEALVSVIQRAWSQLDIDASMLLDSLGDSDIPAKEGDSSELLTRLVHAGSKSRTIDPTDLSSLAQLDVDEWSTEEQIEADRLRAEEDLLRNEEEEEEAMNAEFGGKLEDTLVGHAAFTLNLLERLCNAIAEAETLTQTPEVVNAVTEAKALHAERLVLTDRITKMSSEIINLSARLQTVERQKNRAERDLYRLQTDLAKSAASTSASSSSSSSSQHQIASGAGGEGVGGGGGGGEGVEVVTMTVVDTEAEARFKAAEKDMQRKIAVLERQLTQSEADKAKSDMALTKRLAQPLSGQDQLVVGMRKALEDMRSQNKQRLQLHNKESAELQEKIYNLELGMQQLEATCALKCREAVGQAEVEIKSMRASRDSMQSTLFSAKAELAQNNLLKSQVTEMQKLEEGSRIEATKLQNRIKELVDNQAMLQTHLAQSKAREERLETLLEEAKNGEKEDDLASSHGGGAGGGMDVVPVQAVEEYIPNGDYEEGEVPSDSETQKKEAPPTAIVYPVKEPLAQAQARSRDTQKELDDARSSINDLILEIEAVAAEEAKAREQVSRLLKQITEVQAAQRGITEENLRLHDQIADLQRKHIEMENRDERNRTNSKQSEALVTRLLSVEQGLKTELQTAKTDIQEEHSKRITAEQSVTEMQQRATIAEQTFEAHKKKHEELVEHCETVTQDCAQERKLRLASQREIRKPAKREEGASSSSSSSAGKGTLSDEDSAMLDLTLSMLRCSVCKDRFKEVTITRCYHLFCKECIDETLRNRSRKCPACGEKFGQDDVRAVFLS